MLYAIVSDDDGLDVAMYDNFWTLGTLISFDHAALTCHQSNRMVRKIVLASLRCH